MQQAAARAAPKSNILEEYNPFEDENRSTAVQIGQQQNQAPAQFPAYNQNSQTNSAYGKPAPQISTEELQVNGSSRQIMIEAPFFNSNFFSSPPSSYHRDGKRNWNEKHRSWNDEKSNCATIRLAYGATIGRRCRNSVAFSRAFIRTSM